MESLDLRQFAAIELPRFLKVKQCFEKKHIGDIAKEIRTRLAPHLADVRGKKIAIGIGSRGIANIKEMAKTLVDELITAGRNPSHSGYGQPTADRRLGQPEVLRLMDYGGKHGVPIDAHGSGHIGDLTWTPFTSLVALAGRWYCRDRPRQPHTFSEAVESGRKDVTMGLGKLIGADSA